MTTNMFRCTPRQLRSFLLDCFYANVVPMVRSSPGVGKSSIMASVADELRLKMIDHRLSTSAREDMSGLPRFTENRAKFVPFEDLFPLEDDPIPKGHEGWMLFLDEINSAPKEMQAPAYKLILDRMVGQHKLHPNLVISAAGNLDTDRAITNPFSTALKSRVVHLELEVCFEEWLYDVALKQGYDNRIIAFLNQYPSLLMDFNPSSQEHTFCCPRTWEFVNRLVKNREELEPITTLLAGTITSGVAVNFVQFAAIWRSLITVEQILNDPYTCPIPHDNSLKWATISHMMEKTTADNFDKLAAYADRFSLDFRVLFYRAVLVRAPKLRQHPAFMRAMAELTRYLKG